MLGSGDRFGIRAGASDISAPCRVVAGDMTLTCDASPQASTNPDRFIVRVLPLFAPDTAPKKFYAQHSWSFDVLKAHVSEKLRRDGYPQFVEGKDVRGVVFTRAIVLGRGRVPCMCVWWLGWEWIPFFTDRAAGLWWRLGSGVAVLAPCFFRHGDCIRYRCCTPPSDR